jgi:hypothetical protein
MITYKSKILDFGLTKDVLQVRRGSNLYTFYSMLSRLGWVTN